jgi:hypothetical protein
MESMSSRPDPTSTGSTNPGAPWWCIFAT